MSARRRCHWIVSCAARRVWPPAAGARGRSGRVFLSIWSGRVGVLWDAVSWSEVVDVRSVAASPKITCGGTCDFSDSEQASRLTTPNDIGRVHQIAARSDSAVGARQKTAGASFPQCWPPEQHPTVENLSEMDWPV
ncbi:uncharacterized protein BDZ99DRAFT_479843 [Mytilinidion resinicola]|uniref:Uncharacterized protein n=1 Tax=Mytilinidion resinicola TaxID=574789 RepID=A0A6A6YAS7_9PEZI|nr:uncharacterized protein BDZ99DRAFT_479843 [Mytilinidion resinicola]KAF2805810.1 hypothetical protein BDZ99DRAFT_479843 [Mytilinidion resinicola]